MFTSLLLTILVHLTPVPQLGEALTRDTACVDDSCNSGLCCKCVVYMSGVCTVKKCDATSGTSCDAGQFYMSCNGGCAQESCHYSSLSQFAEKCCTRGVIS